MADPKDFLRRQLPSVDSGISRVRESGANAADVNSAGYGAIGSLFGGPKAAAVSAYKSIGKPALNPAQKQTTAFAHETDNNVPSGKNLSFNFQPNILDNLDVVTYHWKFFMVSPQTIQNGNVLDPRNQIVIAETAVTDTTIDNVSFDSIALPVVPVGTGTQTTIRFEIIEPSGAALLDKMYYSSLDLGIENWLTTPFYIQLTFKNRTAAESSSTVEGASGDISTLVWVWPIKLSKAAANVTEVGTKYDFEGIAYSELAQSDIYSKIQHNISLEKLTTFESAIRQLETKINIDQTIKTLNHYEYPDIYTFVVDEKIAGYTITPPNNNQDSIRNNTFASFKEKTATINAGTSIDKIVDALLSHTKEYQILMTHAQAPGQEGVPMPRERSQMKKFWRVVTESKPLKYDRKRQTNANEFTIYILEYDVGGIDSNSSQTESFSDSKESALKRLATFVNKNLLRKRYNYIFTGLNDQVIKFDLAINFAFSTLVARYGGAYLNGAMADKGVVNQNNSADELDVTNKIRQALSFQNAATSADTTGAATALINAKNAIQAAKLSPDIEERYTRILNTVKAEDRLKFVNNLRGRNTDTTTVEGARKQAANLAEPVSVPRFVADAKKPSVGKLRAIPYLEGPQDQSIGNGLESSSNSGVNKLSSMFALALYSGLDANLQSINMTIKGDPFWLFPQPIKNKLVYLSDMAPGEAIAYIKNNDKGNNTVNVYSTDNYILIRFRSPRIFENQLNTPTDEADNEEVEVFSGIYKVNQITSRFEHGKFTQELKAVIDPDINIKYFIKDLDAIESSAALKDIPVGISDLSRVSAYPDTAIKKAKLATTEVTKGIENQVFRSINGNE